MVLEITEHERHALYDALVGHISQLACLKESSIDPPIEEIDARIHVAIDLICKLTPKMEAPHEPYRNQ